LSLGYYVDLLRDPARIDGFREGLSAEVRPGESVLEVGTGIGTYAFFAAQAGAGRVVAVDRAPILHLAKAIGRDNDLNDIITWIRGDLQDIPDIDPIDLLVFEDFAVRFLDDRVWRLLRDAQRHLASSGRLFPSTGRMCMAPVHGAEVENLFALPAESDWVGADLDWSAIEPYLTNLPRVAHLGREALATPPHRGTALGLQPLPSADALSLDATWTIPDECPVRGIATWFELELGEGGVYDNGPGDSDGVWGQVVLPVHPPLVVPAGETVRAAVSRDALPDGAPGWFRWSVTAGNESRAGHEFAGEPASLDDLLPQEPRDSDEMAV